MRIYWLIVCLLCILCSCSYSEGSLQFSAETSRPELSTFIPGEKITLKFKISGLTETDSGLKLILNIADESDKNISQQEIPITADTSGNWQAEVNAPNSRLGFYRVYVKLSNGMLLPRLRSRPAGYITYCIVPDPALRPLYPTTETYFGMQGGFCPTVNVLPYLGIRWVLGGYTWNAWEPNFSGEFAQARKQAREAGKTLPGANDFSWCKLNKNGKEVPWTVYKLPTMYSSPKWAAIPETAAYSTAALSPEGEKAWRSYCEEVGRALHEDMPDMKEHLVQITWEPVYPWGYKGTDEQLIRIHQIAYEALHKSDPKIRVLGPTGAGISKTDVDWNIRLIKSGLSKYIDGLSIHPYHVIPPERENYINNVRSLKDGLLKASTHPLSIYGTEQGKATNEDKNLELDQALGLVRENLIFFGEGAKINFAFYIVDYPGEPGYGYYYNLNPKMDWGTDKTAPKPVAPAFAAMTYMLEGHKSAGAIEWMGETAWGYAFERGDDIILAVWDYGDTPRQVSIPVGVKQVDLHDWMGNKETLKTTNGSVKVTLTQKPVYIKGVSAKLWSLKAEKPLKLDSVRLASFPGDTLNITGNTASSAKNLKLVVESEDGLLVKKISCPITAKPGKRSKFALNIPVPANAKPGTYSMKITLAGKSGPVAASAVILTLAPSIAVQKVSPVQVSQSKTSVQVILANRQNRNAKGSVQLKIQGVPESTQTISYSIAAKSRQILTFSYADLDVLPERTYSAIAAVQPISGTRSEESFAIDFLNAKKLAKSPAIDGDLSDWSDVPAAVLMGKEFCVRSKDYFNPSLTAKIKYAWDEKALYLAAEIHDNTFIQDYTGFNTWKGDCLQLGFDLDPGTVSGSTGNMFADTAVAKRRVSEIDLALTSNDPEAFRTATFDNTKYPVDLISKSQLLLSITRNGNTTVYEAEIPWNTLGLSTPPQNGQFIGTAMTVNDMNDSKQLDPSALGLFGGIAGSKNPDKYGTLLLGGVE